jgi:hypothetical protein
MRNPSRTPSTYIALFRGINVGRHKIIKMDQLRKSLEAMGFADVATYVQSGNVVFKTFVKMAQSFVKENEEMLLREFSTSIPPEHGLVWGLFAGAEATRMAYPTLPRPIRPQRTAASPMLCHGAP